MRLPVILPLLAVAGLCAADNVGIIATTPSANEQSLVNGRVMFYRLDGGSPLTVGWHITGSARSNLHGGQIRSISLANAGGAGFRRSAFPISFTNNVTPTSQPSAMALGVGGVISSINVTSNGSRYAATPPVVTITDSYGLGAAWVPTMAPYIDVDQSTQYFVGNFSPDQLLGGQGYVGDHPVVLINAPANPLGTQATATLTVTGSALSSVRLDSEGYGYPMPSITISGTGTGAVARAVVTNGAISGIAIESAGSGYGAGTTATVNANGSGGMNASLTVAVTPILSDGSGGLVSAIAVNIPGSGYGPTVTANDGYGGGASLNVVMAGPDFQIDADYDGTSGVQVTGIDASGNLYGTITLSSTEVSRSLMVVPVRNGVGGAREVVVSIDPSPTSDYVVEEGNAAGVTIADADVQATITTLRPVAYPTPPTITSNTLPIEVQGRGEWLISLNNSTLYRSVAVEVGADTSLEPLAQQDTEYILGLNTVRIEDTVNDFATVMPQNATSTTPPPGPGSTSIYVDSTAYFNGGELFCFEYPSNVTNGIYAVTSVDSATATSRAKITFTPALKVTQTSYGTTRVRRLAEKISAPVGGGLLRNTNYGYISSLRYFAFPVIDANAPRARRSINMTLVQSDDYRTLSPTSATVALADDAVTLGVKLVNNSAKPATNGRLDVVLSSSYSATDIDVPFMILDGGTAVFGSDYTIDGVNAATKIGSVHVSANSATTSIIIKPLTLVADNITKSLTIQLLPSPDYLLVPTGTSPVNPSSSVFISPAPKTTFDGGHPIKDVFLSINSVTVAEDAGTATLTINLSDDVGVTLDPFYKLQNGIALSLSLDSLHSSATAGADFITPPLSLSMPAGTNSATITIPIRDDNEVEGIESLQLKMLSGVGYQLSNASVGVVTITDNEPSVTIAAGTSPIEGGAAATYTITASRPVSVETVIGLSIAGTATSGSDYPALPTSVTIPNGGTSATVSMTASSDAIVDPGETVIVTLQADANTPASYSLGVTTSAAMTIGEPPITSVATIGIVAAAPTVSEGTTTSFGAMVVYATRSGATNPALSIPLTIGGTALPGGDYTALTATADMPELVTTAIAPAGAGFLTVQVVGSTTVTLPAGALLRVGATNTYLTLGDQIDVGTTPVVIGLSGAIASSIASGTSIGVSSALLKVTPINDTSVEGNETAQIALSWATGANWTPDPLATSAVVTIVDDETPTDGGGVIVPPKPPIGSGTSSGGGCGLGGGTALILAGLGLGFALRRRRN